MKDSVHAVIVGIETYDQPGWNIAGPGENALAVVESLLSIGVSADNIVLFLDASPETTSRAQFHAEKGVAFTPSAKWSDIDEFWRNALLARDGWRGNLLIYWSGHGCTSTDGSRILFCRDYTVSGLINRVFNATQFLRVLHSIEYRKFRSQVFLADVCGVYANLPIATTNELRSQDAGTEQLALFATPEGQYARGSNGRGLFTAVVVDALSKLTKWPSLVSLGDAIRTAAREQGQNCFQIGGTTPEAHFPAQTVDVTENSEEISDGGESAGVNLWLLRSARGEVEIGKRVRPLLLNGIALQVVAGHVHGDGFADIEWRWLYQGWNMLAVPTHFETTIIVDRIRGLRDLHPLQARLKLGTSRSRRVPIDLDSARRLWSPDRSSQSSGWYLKVREPIPAGQFFKMSIRYRQPRGLDILNGDEFVIDGDGIADVRFQIRVQKSLLLSGNVRPISDYRMQAQTRDDLEHSFAGSTTRTYRWRAGAGAYAIRLRIA